MTKLLSTPKKVGIIGEHPQNDAEAMIALLERYKQENVCFELIDVKNFHGSAMFNPKFASVLVSQLYGEDFDHLIVLCDLDFTKEKVKREKDKIKDRDKWFGKVNKSIDNIGVFFLIIYELEALMLCDTDVLSRFFQTAFIFEGNPIKEKYPKEYIQEISQKTIIGKYEEKNATAIFKKLHFEKIYEKHTGERSFQTFADELKRLEIIFF